MGAGVGAGVALGVRDKSVELRNALGAATVELPDADWIQSYRDAPTETRAEGLSPGAENRRRRRRERAEVAAKLDATEARLSAMRLEDARRAEAKAAEV